MKITDGKPSANPAALDMAKKNAAEEAVKKARRKNP